MRTRDHIMADFNAGQSIKANQERLSLEVMLDIRDCLVCITPTEREQQRISELVNYGWENMIHNRTLAEKELNKDG